MTEKEMLVSAFLTFSIQKRLRSTTHINIRGISNMWNMMSPDQKQVFIGIAEENKSLYSKICLQKDAEYPDYVFV